MDKSRPRLIAWALEAFFLVLIIKQALADPSWPRLLHSVLAGGFACWGMESLLRQYQEYKAKAPHPPRAIEYLAIVLLCVVAVWTLWSGFAAYGRNEWGRAIFDGLGGLAILWICWKSLPSKDLECGDQ